MVTNVSNLTALCIPKAFSGDTAETQGYDDPSSELPVPQTTLFYQRPPNNERLFVTASEAVAAAGRLRSTHDPGRRKT